MERDGAGDGSATEQAFLAITRGGLKGVSEGRVYASRWMGAPTMLPHSVQEPS